MCGLGEMICFAKGIESHLIKKLPYGTKGVLRGKFAPADSITFYTQYGDYIARWSQFITVSFFLIGLSGRLKESS